MTALLEWALFLPLVLSLVTLFYGPGYFLATIFNAGPFVVRVVAAPAWTFAFVGLTSVLMHHFGVVWSRYSYTTVLLLLAGVAALSRAITWRSRPGGMDRVWQRAKEVLPKFLGVIAAWLVTILPVISAMGPRLIMQGGDAPYHYNQIWLMARTGNADPMSANQGLLGLSDGRSYYPNVWHSLGALIDFRSQYALVAGNTLLLMAPLVWVAGIAVLCQRLFPENPRSWLWAIAATFLLPAFPLRLELAAGMWPYVMALATVPGASHGRGGWGGSPPEPFLWLVWRWRTRPPSVSSSGSSRRSQSGCPRRRPSPRMLKETGEEPGCSPLPVQRSACSPSPLSSHRGRSRRSSAATPSAVGATWAPSSWSWRPCASRARTSITPQASSTWRSRS